METAHLDLHHSETQTCFLLLSLHSYCCYMSQIESALQSMPMPIMSFYSNEDAIARTLKESLRQHENPRAQGASLQDILREMKRKDDIHDDLFKDEITKHYPICAKTADSIAVQAQILIQTQVLFRGTHWLRTWAKLQQSESIKEGLLDVCRLLETVALQLFASFGWPFVLRIGYPV